MPFNKIFNSLIKTDIYYLISKLFYLLPFRFLNFFIFLLGFPILCKCKYTSFRKDKSIGAFQWIQFINHDKIEFKENKFKKVILLSCRFGNYLQFFALINRRGTLMHDEFALNDQLKVFTNYLRLKDLQKQIIKERLITLNYSVNHFGHFIGENLGSIIYYYKKYESLFIDNKIKFLIFAPSKDWENFIKEICPNIKLFSLEKLENLYSIYKLQRCIVLPCLSSYQNMILSRNYLINFMQSSLTLNKYTNVYLSNDTSSRIKNKIELDKWLLKNNFTKVDPLQLKPFELLKILYESEFVISNQGSIILNAFAVRNKPMIILSPHKNICQRDYSGGIIYNSICFGMFNELTNKVYKEEKSNINSDHIFTYKIIVNIKELNNLFLSMKNKSY